MHIDEKHKRPIETTFWMLDELLCLLERWANGNEIHSLLYHEHNALSDKQRLQLRDEIAVLQNLILQVKDKLELKSHHRDIGMAIQGLVELFMENIDELEGHRLRSYGEPAPELVAYLDPKVKEFNQHLSLIAHIGTEAMDKNQD